MAWRDGNRLHGGVLAGRCARKGFAGRGNSEGKGWEAGLMAGKEPWFGRIGQEREV